jgi:transcriptional regulator with XRE-family HTH domain
LTALAKKVGVGSDHLSKIFRGIGYPSLPLARKLAKELRMSLDELMERLRGARIARERGALQIFKVQLPLATNHPTPSVLIYNEDGSFNTLLPFDEETRKRLGGEAKAFWYGRIKGSVVHLECRAPWQEW